MKGTPDRRRISSYSAINYSYPCFPLHKYHTSRSYDKQAREQEQILVINCQSDAAAGDIVRIKHGCILCLVQLALMAHKSFQQQLGSFGPERPFRCLDNRTLPRLSCSSHLAQKLC